MRGLDRKVGRKVNWIPDNKLLVEHRRWLSGFDAQYLRNWEKLLAADPEAGACEAAVRQILESNGNRVEPNENLTGATQSPDFRCEQAGEIFYVEVTCISIKKATEMSGMTHQLQQGAFHYGQLNGAIFNASRQKTPQCAGLGAPALIAIGTFHFQASALCFQKRHIEMLLTGQELITAAIDAKTGDAVGETYLSTQLRSAAFVRPGEHRPIEHARNPVSGMVLCGFGSDPAQIVGVIHPQPIHKFRHELLPRFEFCRLLPGYEDGILATEWI